MNANTAKQKIAPELLFPAIEAELAEGRNVSFTVTGMSMWPFICHGRDQVILSPCDTSQLKVLDIVLFQTPLKNYMLHRITGLKENTFETTGDGNCFHDGWFDKDCIVGKVTAIYRNGKRIDCNSFLWKMIFCIWTFLFPVRKYLLKSLRFIGMLKARIRKHVRN